MPPKGWRKKAHKKLKEETPVDTIQEEPMTELPQPDPVQAKSIGRVHPEDYRIFWGPHDKGAAKPDICYPQRLQTLREEVQSMERSLEMGYISAERKMAYEARLKERRARLDSIDENIANTRKIINENKDFWVRRRNELAEEIRDGQPSRTDIEKRRVNPYRIAKMEKEGFGELKKEYIVISRALGEESNVSFLQRD